MDDTEVVLIPLYHFYFTLFQWAMGRIWYLSISNIYSNTWNCSLVRERILLINTILLCFNWLWRISGFAGRVKQTVWQVSGCYYEALVSCVVLFFRKIYIYKFGKIFLIMSLLKIDRLQNYTKQWHCSKIFWILINYWKESFVEFYLFWRNYKT